MIKFITDTESGEQLRVDDFDVLDADQAIFFSRQLEAVKARTYDVKYAELKFRDLFPVSNEAGPGATSIVYWTYDQAGMSKIIASGYSRDLPRADIGGKETLIPVRELGIAVGWTMGEIRKAARAGLPIDARKMNAATRGNEQTLNNIAYFGDATHNLVGLFTQPNIPTANAPNGAGGTPEWTTKTVDEIIEDALGLLDGVFTTTKMVERPNTLLLTPDEWSYLGRTRLGENNDTTILEYLAKTSPYLNSIDDIIPVNELVGAGTGGSNVAVAYRRDPDALQFEIPMELMFHPEQRIGLEIEVPAECSTAGLNVYYPLSLSILEDVG
jgi:hypothetical protein